MDPSLLPRLARLEAKARDAAAADPAHDFAHVERVVANARRIAAAEGADETVAIPAALLHELFSYPKGHPLSPRSGEVCAERAAAALAEVGWPAPAIPRIAHAIRVHPFSLGIVPDDLESRTLQDADRLDSLGAIGIARLFATCAAMGRPLYAPEDPFCRTREPDDKAYGLDHVYRKLLRIPAVLHTATARALAGERVAFLRAYLDQLGRELGT